VLVPAVGAGYQQGVGPGVYPFQATVTGFTNGVTQYLCLRAFDLLGHEEQNQVVLTAQPVPRPPIVIDGSFGDWPAVPALLMDPDDAPDSAGPDWLDIWIQDDDLHLFVRFRSANAFNLDGSPTYGYSRSLVFFDLDGDPATGWPIGGIGSDLLLAGGELFRQTSASFNAGTLGAIAAAPVVNVTECELAIPWSAVDQVVPGASLLRVLFVNDETWDRAPDAGVLTYQAQR
jgi:hypothetical protein